jgi:3-deoxy-D-manno-octulosonic-acid transferase
MSYQSPGLGYRLLSVLLLPIWLIQALWHGQTQGLKNYFRLRCWGNKSAQKPTLTWVHASSVGEIESITPLVRKLLDSGESILLTSFTASGYKSIKRNFNDSVESAIIPVDFVWACKRFLHQHPIKLCLLMETELWPEMLYQTARRAIPIIQVNARLSRKSLQTPAFVKAILERSLGYISLHLTRNDSDRSHLIELGADPLRIKVIGNLKSSIDLLSSYPRLIEAEYLLIASSHEGEETKLLAQAAEIPEKPLIVIAPRHPTRSKSIQQQLSQLGINHATRSQSEPIEAHTEVYLADTLGELKALMAHARIVIMGGSFNNTGGHNLIEPAALACAIITGPSDDNIRADIKLLEGAVIQVADVATCWQQVEYLLSNPDQAKSLGLKALEATQKQSHTLDNYLVEIKSWL